MSGASPDECVEQIDIGGPSMVRAAAKNHPTRRDRHLAGAVRRRARRGRATAGSPSRSGAGSPPRRSCTPRPTTWTSRPGWATSLTDTTEGSGFPAWIGATWDKAAVLRYGENPHQQAALYTSGFAPEGGLAQATQLHGKEMSYNNYVDADAARRAAYDFDRPAVAIIKHANPCGIAVGADVAEAHRKRARLRPGVGVRRRDRHQRAGEQGDGRAGRRGVHRGRRRARLRGRRRRGAVGEEEHPAARSAGRCRAAAWRSGRSPAACSAAARRDRRRLDNGGDDPAAWRLACGDAASRARTSPTSRSPGGPAGR